jgi:general secretion pathway protein K
MRVEPRHNQSKPAAHGRGRRHGWRDERGSGLLLVLWAIMLMGFAVIGLVNHLSRHLDESRDAEKKFRAHLLLQSARTLTTHPDIERGDPLLRQAVSTTSSYEVTLSTEGVRLAINELGTSPVQRRFAQRLFESWGLDSLKAQTLAESIADWIDVNDRPRPHGAENNHYTAIGHLDFPFNRPFQNIGDVLLVRGADELDKRKPNWRDYFTLHGDGTIDMHLASGEILEALFDVGSAEVGRLVRARVGPDRLRDTEDDLRFTTLTEVRRLLDVPEANYKAVLPLLTLEHPIKRVECVARVGGMQRRLTVLTGPGLKLVREE